MSYHFLYCFCRWTAEGVVTALASDPVKKEILEWTRVQGDILETGSSCRKLLCVCVCVCVQTMVQTVYLRGSARSPRLWSKTDIIKAAREVQCKSHGLKDVHKTIETALHNENREGCIAHGTAPVICKCLCPLFTHCPVLWRTKNILKIYKTRKTPELRTA